jgi:CHAT domain
LEFGPLVPAQEILKSLFDHLVAQGRFSEAARIAKVYMERGEPGHRTTLLESLLQIEALPDLVQAEVSEALGVLMLSTGNMNEGNGNRYLEKARQMYIATGHGYGLLMLEVKSFATAPKNQKSKEQAVKRLKEIKKQLEQLGYWWGVQAVLQAMLDIDDPFSDSELQAEIDCEILKLHEIRGCTSPWLYAQLASITKWTRDGGNSVHSLRSLESLYKQVCVTENPRLQGIVASFLFKRYQELGKTDEMAGVAQDNPGVFPRHMRFLVGMDKFCSNLIETKESCDEHTEELELQNHLLEIEEDLADSKIVSTERYHGVMHATNMCEYYLTQKTLRGLKRTKLLVDMCLATSNLHLKHLNLLERYLWTGKIRGVESRLRFSEACDGPTINAESVQDAVAIQKDARSYFKWCGSRTDRSSSEQSLAILNTCLFAFDSPSPTSLFFDSAAYYYECAADGFRQTGLRDSERNTAFNFAQLWFRAGPKGSERYRLTSLGRFIMWIKSTNVIQILGATESPSVSNSLAWLFYKKVEPYDQTMKWLRIAEKFWDEQRSDLSALGGKAALISKQLFRRDEKVRNVYECGLKSSIRSEDWKALWSWIQKSKARSLSDMLGLGINIPKDLERRIKEDVNAQKLVDREIELVNKVKNGPADNVFVRKDIDRQRQAMRKLDILDDLLAIREGREVTAEQLRATSQSIEPKKKSRRIFFVDWFSTDGNIGMLLTSSDTDDIQYYDTDMEFKEIRTWIDQNMRGTQRVLDHDSLEPLNKFGKLIEPLLKVTNEQDLLVFCTTGILQSLPLHASVINPLDFENPIFLIDRNPVVYIPSLTVFEQCVRKKKSSEGDTTGHVDSYLAALEQPGLPRWERDRYSCYETVGKMGSRREKSRGQSGVVAKFGFEATRSAFVLACQQSETVTFLGHFCPNRDNIMDAALQLVAEQKQSGSLGKSVFENLI